MTKATQRKPALPPRRRARDADRTRAVILQAAREVFILGDYHQASLSDIARRAGVTPSLIHHHFGSKKGLFISAMHAYLTELDEDLKGIVQPSLTAFEDDAEFIASAMQGYFRFLASNEQCVRLYRILDLSLHNDPDLLAGLGELDDQGRKMSSLHLIRAGYDRLVDMKQRGSLRADVEPLAFLSALLCTIEHWFTSSRRLNHRLCQAVGLSEAQGGVSEEAFLRTSIKVFVRGALVAAPGLPD